MTRRIDILIPALNEQECLPLLHQELSATLDDLPYAFRIIIIDDGSTDDTHEVCDELRGRDPRVGVIRLSRNFGHQAALTAGLDASDADAVITMDADLQHPPAAIPSFIDAWQNGAKIVTGVRSGGARAGPIKRLTSRLFYAFLSRLASVPITANAPDFRLLDRKVVAAVCSLREQSRFLRGIYGWTGFEEVTVAYDQRPRAAGKAKYGPVRMVRFALSAVLSFSRTPLRLATYFGVAVSALTFAYGIYALIAHLVFHVTIRGWTSLAVLLSFLSGIQLITLGVIGEYVGQVLDETKRRPLYVAAETHLPAAKDDDNDTK